MNYSGPLAGGKLEATAQYGIHDWREWQEIGVAGGPDRSYSDYAEDTRSGELGLTYIRPLKPKWTLETRLIHQFESFDDVATGSDTTGGVVAPRGAGSRPRATRRNRSSGPWSATSTARP